jgi:MoxR-like ATPase
MKRGHLASLGVYGFDGVEPVILAALVSEDPLLLIGRSGTGKTFLLNSLSEALGLEHRHYNASMVNFDDLVGFPYPDDEKASVRFLETPATIWGAESVLVDEISRCRPEHQNRLFSLVHERRIQGIALSRLRFRWAAMNPCSVEDSRDYAGSEPLDQALADRFGLILEVGDWDALRPDEKLAVADPAGEGAVSRDEGRLCKRLAGWRREFEKRVRSCPPEIMAYASAAATALNEAGLRVSPRRARMLSRSLLAATIVEGRPQEAVFREILGWSLPHRAWGAKVRVEQVRAAHRLAWDSACLQGTKKWLHEFHLESSLPRKVEMLLRNCWSPDIGAMAVAQMLSTARPERAAAFAFALFPAAATGRLEIGAEAIGDLGKVAQPVLHVDAEISWMEPPGQTRDRHPEFVRLTPIVERLNGPRKDRARQLFYWSIVAGVEIEDPEGLEREFDECVAIVREALA